MSSSICSIKNGIKYISVIGELENEQEIQEFLNILEDRGCKEEIHITFLHNSTLNSKIIEKIEYFQKHKLCKVYVVKSYLYSYMWSLGIGCYYIPEKIIKPKGSLPKRQEYHLDEKNVLCFLKQINERYGYDYSEYQIDSIIRRIKISMLKQNTNDFDDFKNLILQSESKFEQLFLDFSINTTEFFRDPQVFAAIKNRVFPYIESYSHIRIWSVGCSTGEEAYSLAILLKEAGLLHKTQIYATDINPYVIEEAQNALYSIESIEKGIRNYRKAEGKNSFVSYFEIHEHYMKLKDELKKNILFFQHSLLGKGIINEFQLILCRNVLIYFNIDLQKKVLAYLHNSLDRNGFLVLGKSGGILPNDGSNYFCYYDDLNKIYKKK